MSKLICSMQHPAVRFACEEWDRLFSEYNHLWLNLASFKTVYIGTWEEIIQLGKGGQLEEELELRQSAPLQGSYWVELTEDELIMAGSTHHATLYAVYEAFRQYAGVHWIYPGEAPVQAEPTAMNGMNTKLYEPLFERRGFVIENYYDPPYILQMIDWCAKNRVNEIFFTFMLWDKIKDEAAPEIEKRGMELTLGGHSMKFFLNKQEAEKSLTADNPYHAKKQLDYADTSWQEPLFEQVAAYCATIPQLTRISLWPEDLPAGDNKAFLALYISFIERLQSRLLQTLPGLQFEHIAYNAGLAWNMLELGDTEISPHIDTLLAYWGRDYRSGYEDSPSADDRRAAASIADWANAVRSKGRKLTIFEYYSDHFMYSALFPSIPSRIVADMDYYRQIGVQSITNLIVPCFDDEHYNWKWAAGFNSYVFSRAAWGDTEDHILDDYYSFYDEQDRVIARQLLETVEATVTGVTAWNFPLFPGRVVDVRKFNNNEQHRRQVIALLTQMNTWLAQAFSQASPGLAGSELGAYMRHLIELSRKYLEAWSAEPEAEAEK